MAIVRDPKATGGGVVVGVILVVLIVVVLVFAPWLLLHVQARYWGLVPVVAAAALVIGATGTWNPLVLSLGADNRLSLSKAQTLLWTAVVLYSYAALYAHDLRVVTSGEVSAVAAASAATVTPAPTPTPAGTPTPAPLAVPPPKPLDFPQSVLLLLGFSITTLIGAAGITASQVASGAVKKDLKEKPDLSLRWLIADDRGRIDLTRFQVVLWTIVAAGIFLGDTWLLGAQPGKLVVGLPDVGSALVLLMGFGTATYIGGKLIVTPGKPMIYRIVPNFAPAPVSPPASANGIVVAGAGFGQQSPTSFLLVNGAPVPSTSVSGWTDTAITFTLPPAQPWDGAQWKPGKVNLAVAVGPLQSDPEEFTVQ